MISTQPVRSAKAPNERACVWRITGKNLEPAGKQASTGGNQSPPIGRP